MTAVAEPALSETEREPVVLSWSGGKDSSLALGALRDDPRVEVVALLTSVTARYDRISIHGVRHDLLLQQAEALALPLVEVALQPECTNADYEAAFHWAAMALRARFPRLRRIAFGDLYLQDVRAYRERLLSAAGLEGHFPLWGHGTAALARRFIALGYRAHLVCVDSTRLAPTFAGRVFDDALLAELPETVDPCGEGGEFHTFVSDGPIFRTAVPVTTGEIVLRDGRFVYCDLLPAEPAASSADAAGTVAAASPIVAR